MQSSVPSESSYLPESYPSCSICGRSGGSTLTQCANCHRYSHFECREIPVNPAFMVATCPYCNAVLQPTTMVRSNAPPIQLNSPLRPPLQRPPGPQQRQQPHQSNTNIAANMFPAPQHTPPLLLLQTASCPTAAASFASSLDETDDADDTDDADISDGTINPVDLNVDPSTPTQAGQPGFEARRLARIRELTTMNQRERVQPARRPADSSTGTRPRAPRPNRRRSRQ